MLFLFDGNGGRFWLFLKAGRSRLDSIELCNELQARLLVLRLILLLALFANKKGRFVYE